MSPLDLPSNDTRYQLNYPLRETTFHKFVVWLARLIFPLFAVLEVRGLENLPDDGPAVVASNHQVMFDVFPVQLALPRMVFYMGKAELFQNRLLHAIFRYLGAFPVYRGERDTWAIEHAKKILSSGQVLAMFPEGTRSGGKGLALAKPGAARLAIELQCPIVVVSVDGIQKLFKQFPDRPLVKVIIAPPIYPSPDDSPLALTDKLMYKMAENLPEDLRGVYRDKPQGFLIQ